MKKLTLALLFAVAILQAQTLRQLHFSKNNLLEIEHITTGKGEDLPASLPLFSIEINRQPTRTTDAHFLQNIQNQQLKVRFEQDTAFTDGIRGRLFFKNISSEEILLNNILPFGAGKDAVFISGKSADGKYLPPAHDFNRGALNRGVPDASNIPKLFNPFTNSPDTSRSFLYRPGFSPVGVVVPHNNQDLNFCALPLKTNLQLYGLVRRASDTIQNYLLIRTPYRLQVGKEVQFLFYADLAEGDWQEALRKCFQEKMLYDFETPPTPEGEYSLQKTGIRKSIKLFNNALYERSDLRWIRHAYTLHLQFAWDKDYYDAAKGGYQTQAFLSKMKNLYGGDDALIVWPTWPALGMDQRTQWQLMADLPGGLAQQRRLAEECRKSGTKYFISYNPWDDTSEQAGMAKMSDMIAAVSADGVVLDTKAEASDALQAAADAARRGVVLYSEGMATPKDMQGILAGRVHNDIYHVPLLNLNKLIKPDFAIFRVVEVARERVQREYATALFNGYGVEINVMRPGRPEWVEEDYQFWGRCARVLRENSNVFTSGKLTPLVPTLEDGVYVNRWESGENKTLYTIFNQKSEGFQGKLFNFPMPFITGGDNEFHYVDLWNHEEVQIPFEVTLEPFDKKYSGTNNEGSVTVIARMPPYAWSELKGGFLEVPVFRNWITKVWEGNPNYEKMPLQFNSGSIHFEQDTFLEIDLIEAFGKISSKYVVQVFDKEELLDESIVRIPPGTPLLISKSNSTSLATKAPYNMVEIPAGTFKMEVFNGDEFIGYPINDFPKTLNMKRFYMDKRPVTNRQFKAFLNATNYQPADTTNFLKHWKNHSPLPQEVDFPVVNVSYEDAQAYARWAGKRLPTEAEWQYAAQTSDARRWPWGNFGEASPDDAQKVSATFQLKKVGTLDSTLCHPPDGKLYPVGSYPKGANPYGLEDLVGSVWQMTNDWYMSDTYGYVILKGGSYYHPGGSWWYVQGGARPLGYRQMLLRVSQGFERNGTVGFRCVSD